MITILDIPGSNPPNRFLPLIEATLISTNSSALIEETAENLVHTVTTSADPDDALWELWDAFFTVVAATSSHEPLLILLDAIRAQPPTLPNRVRGKHDAKSRLRRHTEADGKLHWSELPWFHDEQPEAYGGLQQWCDWDGVRDPSTSDGSTGSKLSSTVAVQYLRFVNFLATLLRRDANPLNHLTVQVFWACRDVLKREVPGPREPTKHKMSSEQVWALDVRVAVTWVRDGGWRLWKSDPEELRRSWASMEDQTDFYPREDGLTRERWQLWKERLLALSTDEASLDEETRTVVKEAYAVIEEILRDVEDVSGEV